MNRCKSLLILGIVAATIIVGGCCCGGDGETTTIIEKQPVNATPLGDELIKLKEAHEKGALTDQEYQDQKTKLLKGE